MLCAQTSFIDQVARDGAKISAAPTHQVLAAPFNATLPSGQKIMWEPGVSPKDQRLLFDGKEILDGMNGFIEALADEPTVIREYQQMQSQTSGDMEEALVCGSADESSSEEESSEEAAEMDDNAFLKGFAPGTPGASTIRTWCQTRDYVNLTMGDIIALIVDKFKVWGIHDECAHVIEEFAKRVHAAGSFKKFGDAMVAAEKAYMSLPQELKRRRAELVTRELMGTVILPDTDSGATEPEPDATLNLLQGHSLFRIYDDITDKFFIIDFSKMQPEIDTCDMSEATATVTAQGILREYHLGAELKKVRGTPSWGISRCDEGHCVLYWYYMALLGYPTRHMKYAACLINGVLYW